MKLSLSYLKRLEISSHKGAEALLAVLRTDDLKTVDGKTEERSLFTKKELRRAVGTKVSTSLINTKKAALLFANRVRNLPDIIKSMIAVTATTAFGFDQPAVNTALKMAVRANSLDVMEKILEIPNINISIAWEGVFESAAYAGNQDLMISTLARPGVEITPESWERAFIAAAAGGHQDIMEFIYARPDIDISNTAWNDVFIEAARDGHAHVIDAILIDCIMIAPETWDVALTEARYGGHQSMVRAAKEEFERWSEARANVRTSAHTASVGRVGALEAQRAGQEACAGAGR